MRRLNYLLINVVQTLLRLFPFPCKTGLVKIGNPGRDAPVLLTGNFRLTVERVRRALAAVDAYLLVANSRGVNVWCAATGGLLTNHDVVSVLKTSEIEDLVDHRRIILPQLAATGIEGRVIHEKTGWSVVWGPVEATSIPRFLAGGMEKSAEMRSVRFPWRQRLEMAVAWAFPISLVLLLLAPILRVGVLPLIGFVWGWAVLIFLSFPLYHHRLSTTGRNVGLVFFDFGQRCFPLWLWGFGMLALTGWTMLTGTFSWTFLLRWGLASFIVVLIFALDLTGSTPVYKSGLHQDRLLRIELDEDQCNGAGFCEQVCPTDVIEVDHHRKLASLPRAGQCVQCGACIAQCPFDALHFRSPNGDVVPPETIRRFKLNLLGERKIGARSAELP